MSVWGVEGGTCCEELLKLLGLVSYGGTSMNGKMCYTIYSIDKSKNIKFHVLFDEIKNIKNIYHKYIKDIRKEKFVVEIKGENWIQIRF